MPNDDTNTLGTKMMWIMVYVWYIATGLMEFHAHTRDKSEELHVRTYVLGIDGVLIKCTYM